MDLFYCWQTDTFVWGYDIDGYHFYDAETFEIREGYKV